MYIYVLEWTSDYIVQYWECRHRIIDHKFVRVHNVFYLTMFSIFSRYATRIFQWTTLITQSKACTLMVNSSTNISKANNHSLFNSLNTVKDHTIWCWKFRSYKKCKSICQQRGFRMERGLESIDTAAANSILKDSVDLHPIGLISRLRCGWSNIIVIYLCFIIACVQFGQLFQ